MMIPQAQFSNFNKEGGGGLDCKVMFAYTGYREERKEVNSATVAGDQISLMRTYSTQQPSSLQLTVIRNRMIKPAGAVMLRHHLPPDH